MGNICKDATALGRGRVGGLKVKQVLGLVAARDPSSGRFHEIVLIKISDSLNPFMTEIVVKPISSPPRELILN